MHRICKALKSGAGSRAGITLTEVLLGLAVFMTGSVSIIGLFVTASVLHAEGANRRTASFIAEELLAEAQSTRFSEVFAKTQLSADVTAGAGSVGVYATQASDEYPAAAFDLHPVKEVFFPLRKDQDPDRDQGPLLIGIEWIWGDQGAGSFAGCDRGLWRTSGVAHFQDDPVLAPRTWFFVLDDDPLAAAAATVTVHGDPTARPADPTGTNDGAPLSGYIVIDEEWMGYESRDVNGFTIGDLDNDGALDRGIGGTQAVEHAPGTPVTVAREHLFYPGFYYVVQFYPVNAGGSEARLLISVGYKTGNMFRTWFFRGAYAPENA